MIPAPPRISAPPRPAARRALPRPSPRREAHRPQLAPRLTTQTSPPFRHATRDSAQQLHSPPELCTSAVAFRRLRLYVVLGTMFTSAPSHHNPTGIFRSNNSMNVALYLIDSVERHIHGKSARGAAWRLRLAVDVRMAQRVVPVGEQAGTGQGGRLVFWGRPSLGIVPSTPTNGSVGDPEDPARTPRLTWGREIPPVRRKLPNGTMGGLARVRARLGTWQGLHGYA